MKKGMVLGLALAALALAWLAANYDLTGVWRAIGQANVWYVLPAFLFLGLSFALRALRWRMLFPSAEAPALRSVFAALSGGYMFNNVLPSHAGELVRIVLLGRAERIAQSRILGTILVEKAFDLTVFVALVLSVVVLRPVPDWLQHSAIALLGTGAVATGFLLLAPRLVGVAMERLAPALLRQLGPGAAARVQNALEGLAVGIGELGNAGKVLRMLAATAAIWATEITILSLVAAAFSIQAGIVDLLFVLVLITTGMLIPAAPGYVGTYEAFGSLAFDFLGRPHDAGLACVITLHAVQLAGTFVLGAFGLASLRKVLGAGELMRFLRKDEAVVAAGRPNSRHMAPLTTVAIALWIVTVTMAFLLMYGPAFLQQHIERAWPGVVDVRTSVKSLFYRDYVY